MLISKVLSTLQILLGFFRKSSGFGAAIVARERKGRGICPKRVALLGDFRNLAENPSPSNLTPVNLGPGYLATPVYPTANCNERW